MASISTNKKGQRVLQFADADGIRRTMYLGVMPERDVQAVKSHVEAMLIASISKQPVRPETAAWIGGLGDVMMGKLAGVGLVQVREVGVLGPFLRAYVAGRGDVLGVTRITFDNVVRNLTAFLPESTPLRDFTPGDAEEFRRWLKTNQNLSAGTIAKRCQIARQFFEHAVKKRLIDSNPFAGIRGSVRGNPERSRYITREEIAAVLGKCPDDEWRLIVALARFGGLRTPSETLSIRWGDVDWKNGRLRVASPKTAGKGKPDRIIPLFPELREHLLALYRKGIDGPVITRANDPGVNWRTSLQRILKAAKLADIPKPFQNMRASRATELAQEFPEHVVCHWLGHTAKVAQEHYLQTTEEHFAKALQNPTQNTAESDSTKAHGRHAETGITEIIEKLSGMIEGLVGRAGPEQTRKLSEIARVLQDIYAESNASIRT